MKILFVLEHYYPNIGGVEKLFKDLADKLQADGHHVLVLTHKSLKDLPSFECIDGVAVRRLPFYNRYSFTFFSLPWVYHYARQFDIIHTTSYNAAVPAYFSAKLLQKKCIVTFHELWGKLWFQLPHLNRLSKALFYTYEKLIAQLNFDKFIAVSDYTRQALIKSGVDPNKIQLIYNGIDYKRFQQYRYTPPEQFTFTYFGRIGISKGVGILLKASKIFLSENKHAQLKLIVPLKPARELQWVKKFIAENDLHDQIQLLHNLSREKLYTELCHSSCVVIPSYSEGFCFAAVEVIAMGIPVISSDKGALKEVVTGSFIKMKHLSVEELVSALQRAKSNCWAQSPVKHFDLDCCIAQYMQLYQSA